MAKSKTEAISNETKDIVLPYPDRLSPEWSDYVLSQFAPEELVDNHPTVAGLRRLAELYVGEIVDSRPTQVWPVLEEGLGRATVVYEVRFVTPSNVVKTFSDVADVWAGNTDDNFVAYAVSVAATRAEARALRKALKLRAVAIEELAKKVITVTESSSNDDLMSSNQISFLDNRCKQLDIDVVAFINAGEKQYRSVNQVLKSTASKMIKELNRLTNEQDTIPPEIKGYKSDWQNSFSK